MILKSAGLLYLLVFRSRADHSLLDERVVYALRYDGVFSVQPQLVHVQFGRRTVIDFDVDGAIAVPTASNAVQLNTHTIPEHCT